MKVEVVLEGEKRAIGEIIGLVVSEGVMTEYRVLDDSPTSPTRTKRPFKQRGRVEREIYPVGTKIVVIRGDNMYGVKPGDKGTIKHNVFSSPKKSSYLVSWEDGTEGRVRGSVIEKVK